MNKYSFIYIALVLIISLNACRKANLDEISNPEKSVLAYPMKALDRPFSRNNSFLFFRDDYSIIKIGESGDYSTLTNLSQYFPVLSNLNTKYNYINFKESPTKDDFWLNAVVENISNDGYYDVKWLRLDTLGNVKANISLAIPTIDSTFIRDYKNYAKIDNELIWIFDDSKKGSPRSSYLEFLKYNPLTDSIQDSLILLTNMGKFLSLISTQNNLYAFYFTSSQQQVSELNVKIFDKDLNQIQKHQYPIVVDDIYFSRKLASGDHYFIAGSYSGLVPDNQVNKNLMAEIDLKGNIYWQGEQALNSYFYYTDIYQQADSFITAGYGKAMFGYLPFSSYLQQPIKSGVFFMGSLNPQSEHVWYAASTDYGFSSSLAVAKTSYGFAYLVYMSQIDKNSEGEYLWLFKFDNQLKRIFL